MNETQPQSRRNQATENLAEVVLQSTARLLELQATTAQALLRMHSRNAALFGVPDLSQVFGGEPAKQFADLCNTGTNQALKLMRQTNDALCQLQAEVSDLLARQTKLLTEQVRTSLQEIEERSEQAVLQVRDITQKTAQQASHTAQQAIEASQQTAQHAREAVEQASAALQGSGAEERSRSKRGA
jgi:hypothetical protein